MLDLEDDDEALDTPDNITALMRAAEDGDLQRVCELEYEAGRQSFDGVTALMYAAQNGHTDCIRVLLPHEYGLQDNEGWTSLMLAAWNGHTSCVTLLLGEVGYQTGAPYDDTPVGCTALMVAAKYGYADIVRLLLPYEGGLRDQHGNLALWYAQSAASDPSKGTPIPDGHKHVIDLLALEKTPETITRLPPPPLGFTRLMHYAATGEYGALRGCINEARQKDSRGRTALIYAAMYGHPRIIRELLEKEEGMQDDHGWTALMYAIAHGHVGCVTALLSESAIVNSAEETALDIALNSGKTAQERRRCLQCALLVKRHLGTESTNRSKKYRSQLSSFPTNGSQTMDLATPLAHTLKDVTEKLEGIVDSVNAFVTSLKRLEANLCDTGLSIKETPNNATIQTQMQQRASELGYLLRSLEQEERRGIRLQEEISDITFINEMIRRDTEELQRRVDEASKREQMLEEKLRIPPPLTGLHDYKLDELEQLAHNLTASLAAVTKAKADHLSRRCVICNEEQRCVLFSPCDHVCVCHLCMRGLDGKACPLCHIPIEMMMHVKI
ncbi:Ankyrin repeat protein 2 [Giardia muris]|uniref:Ankyrin repeat protein 2 n=1 Tax=Giardia muris TaxID=5742 RepID=A0A4Z1SST7_GIAMU|nr:Ankyrin repeat protein 2 [Giardia muris]|eukprot:TNJ28830.1 Ankyrin repeat protein 2 [Giardia muris]